MIIDKLNTQITDKQSRLASREESWRTYDCDNNDYGESMCPESKIASLKSQIDNLEQQKKGTCETTRTYVIILNVRDDIKLGGKHELLSK